MSKYYSINGKKLRISDHEPNTSLRGSSDIHIWTKDASGNTLSIGGQIDKYCDEHNVEITLFESVIRDFADSDEECNYMLAEIERNK